MSVPPAALLEAVNRALRSRDGTTNAGGDELAIRCLDPGHDDEHPSASWSTSKGVGHCHGCGSSWTTKQVAALLDIDTPSSDRRPETVWKICNRDGVLIASHHRVDQADGSKRVWWSRPNGARKLDRRASSLPLYLTEKLDSYDRSEPVYVTEGEKAADAAERLGLQAVGTVTGASRCPDAKVLAELRGFNVTLWPDHDSPGREHMAQISGHLRAVGVEVLGTVDTMQLWGDASEKGQDAADLGVLPDERLPLITAQVAAAENKEPHLAAIPEYPVTAIPEPLRGLVETGIRAGLPAPYVGAGGLAALAYVARDSRVGVSDSWTEAPVLWIVALGPASTGKSPGWQFGWQPIRDRETELRKEWENELAEWRAAPKNDRGESPPHRTHAMTDTTVEALLRRLAEAGPQVLAVDELRGWLGGLGRYGAGTSAQREIGLYLSCWDAGSPVNYDRVGGDTSIVADEPAVSIVGTLQSDEARLLGGVESGFRARWLPHLYAPRSSSGDPETLGGAVPDAWADNLRRLAEKPPKARYRLDGEARQLWRDARNRWRSEAEDASPGNRTAAAKADRQALRVATCFAVGMGASDAIPTEAMEGAVAILDYVLDCWRALPEGEELTLSRTDERLGPAVDRLAAWLEQRPSGQATKRQILHAQVAGVRTAKERDALLERYEQVYPGSVREGESTSRGGRRGIVVYAPRRAELRAVAPSGPTELGPRTEEAADLVSPANSRPPDETDGTPNGPNRHPTELDYPTELGSWETVPEAPQVEIDFEGGESDAGR